MAETSAIAPTQVRLPLPMELIADFCRRRQIVELALFGSVLRDDFGPDSDVDVMVDFERTARPTLLDLSDMAIELERIFGRSVDLLTRRGVEEMNNPYRRPEILNTAKVIHAR